MVASCEIGTAAAPARIENDERVLSAVSADAELGACAGLAAILSRWQIGDDFLDDRADGSLLLPSCGPIEDDPEWEDDDSDDDDDDDDEDDDFFPDDDDDDFDDDEEDDDFDEFEDEEDDF